MSEFAPRRRRKLVAEMNVVPYLDVMLVLLVIFMVTAPLMQTGVSIDLPNGEGSIEAADEKTIIISLNQNGQLFLSIADDPTSPITRVDLLDTLVKMQSAQQAINPTDAPFQVQIAADAAIAYGRVMDLMHQLQQASIAAVGLITVPSDQP